MHNTLEFKKDRNLKEQNKRELNELLRRSLPRDFFLNEDDDELDDFGPDDNMSLLDDDTEDY